jgi:hypothetical protein
MGSSVRSALLEPFSWRKQLSEFSLQDSWDELAVPRLREEAVSFLFHWILWPKCWTLMSSGLEEWKLNPKTLSAVVLHHR